MDETPVCLVSINESHQAPLREEVADLLFAISVTNSAYKNLASLRGTVRFSGRRKAHLQWSRATRILLHVRGSTVGICRKLKGNKCIGRLLATISILWRAHIAVFNVSILGKVMSHLLLRLVARQTAYKDLEVVPDCLIIIASSS